MFLGCLDWDGNNTIRLLKSYARLLKGVNGGVNEVLLTSLDEAGNTVSWVRRGFVRATRSFATLHQVDDVDRKTTNDNDSGMKEICFDISMDHLHTSQGWLFPKCVCKISDTGNPDQTRIRQAGRYIPDISNQRVCSTADDAWVPSRTSRWAMRDGQMSVVGQQPRPMTGCQLTFLEGSDESMGLYGGPISVPRTCKPTRCGKRE
jgi:hypothetical protein